MRKVIILAIARFRSDQKEAMSKNFVNLVQCLTESGHSVVTVSPTRYKSSVEVEQHTFRDDSSYESLVEGGMNLIYVCKAINRLVERKSRAQINLHIATPIELLLIFLFLRSQYRKQTTISIWQSYLTFEEVRNHKLYFLRNGLKYLHLLLFNSFISASLYKRLLGCFHQVIVHSNYQKSQLSLSKAPVHFVQNGVFSKHFSPPVMTKANLKAKLLYIGHAKPSKGVDALIELAAILKQRGKLEFDLTLCLSGFGGQESVKTLVSEHELDSQTEFKENIDVTVEMASADLLVLPLRTCVGTSLTPNVIVEAFSCRLPIAIPEFEQLSGVVEFGSNAVKIDLGDLEESARTIEVCFESNQLDQLSENQFKKFKDNYTLEQFAYGYSQILGLVSEEL